MKGYYKRRETEGVRVAPHEQRLLLTLTISRGFLRNDEEGDGREGKTGRREKAIYASNQGLLPEHGVENETEAKSFADYRGYKEEENYYYCAKVHNPSKFFFP